MAILNNAALYYESGQVQNVFAALTDSGDHQTFSLAAKPWSNAPGYTYTVAPYGLATGGAITTHATNDTVNVAALTAYMAAATGASATTGLLSVSSGTAAITRGSGGNTHSITSITINSSGAITAVAGTAGTAFSETRAAAGGPPVIPVGSIEIGQVRTTSITAAVVLATEIYQVVGTHQERYDYPVWAENPILGTITFAAALATIHTGTVPKAIYARVATPIFAEIPHARAWVPAETSNSVSSEQYYDGTMGGYSSSLGQASFEAALGDGVTDAILSKKNTVLLFKFMPDKNKTPYQLTQGILGVGRSFGVGAHPKVSFTLSASQATVDVAA